MTKDEIVEDIERKVKKALQQVKQIRHDKDLSRDSSIETLLKRVVRGLRDLADELASQQGRAEATQWRNCI